MSGQLVAIYISPSAGGIPCSVAQARVLTGCGLKGDRYKVGLGTFSPNGGNRAITRIEEEAITPFAHDHGHTLDPALSPRNLPTRGVRLNGLVGREVFRGVGADARAAVVRAVCSPCAAYAVAGATGTHPPGWLIRGGSRRR